MPILKFLKEIVEESAREKTEFIRENGISYEVQTTKLFGSRYWYTNGQIRKIEHTQENIIEWYYNGEYYSTEVERNEAMFQLKAKNILDKLQK